MSDVGESADVEGVDVVIAGNGPVGMLLALALQDARIDHRLIGNDWQAQDRPIALAHSSRVLLERLGAFRALEATPIESIHVSQRGGFGRTLIQAQDYKLPALGYVVSYSGVCSALRQGLEAAAMTAQVSRYSPTSQGDGVLVEASDGTNTHRVRARLLVIAEGSPFSGRLLRSSVSASLRDALEQRRDYGQSAVVAAVESELPHRHRAWERFTAHGPLGMLPFGERLAMVWSTSHESAHGLCALSDTAFLARLRDTFGGRLGRFVSAGPRSAFPLALRYRRGSPAPHVIAVGNAAQTLHPVAGQGLNLGFRDAWELAAALELGSPGDVGSAAFIRAYLSGRSLDRAGGIGITDALVRVFSNDNPVLAASRGLALAVLDTVPPARHFLARRMMFGARALP